MPFVKGRSGNPRGRPPKSAAEKLFRERIARAVPDIIDALVRSAKAGDVAASRTLLERAVSPLKAIELPVEIPLPTDLGRAPEAILEALGDGTLTPGQAANIAATVASLARTAETTEILRRLEHIEGLLNGRQTR